jgi:hypothetical protein
MFRILATPPPAPVKHNRRSSDRTGARDRVLEPAHDRRASDRKGSAADRKGSAADRVDK